MRCNKVPSAPFRPPAHPFAVFAALRALIASRVRGDMSGPGPCIHSPKYSPHKCAHSTVWAIDLARPNSTAVAKASMPYNRSNFGTAVFGRSKSPLATKNLLEHTDGVAPSLFFRSSSLLPSICADARCIDAVVSQRPSSTRRAATATTALNLGSRTPNAPTPTPTTASTAGVAGVRSACKPTSTCTMR